jgi:DNA-binding IclR family transcriptional regulator
MASARAAAGPYEVISVRKALEILCCFSSSEPQFSLSKLSRRLEIPKSTTHNLLRTLQACGFVVQDSATLLYRLGPRILELATHFSPRMQLEALAAPHLRRLMQETRETVKLAVLSDGEALILAAVESPFDLHTRGDVGRRAPLHSTSLGKAILSVLPAPDLRGILARRGLPRFTRRTITTLPTLERELAGIHADGFALDWDESEEGVHCAAAPLPHVSGLEPAAISVSGPAVRLPGERLREVAALARATAAAISRSLRAKA